MVIKVLWLTAIWCQLTRAAAVSGHHIKLLFQSRKSSTLVTMHMTLAALAVAVNTAALCCQRLQAFLFCYACAQQHPPTLSPFSLSATANLQQSGHHVLRAAWSPCQTEIQDPFATIHGGFFLFHKNNSKILQAHSILECFVPVSPLIYDVCTHEHLTRCGHTLRCLYPWRSCVLKFLILLKIINDVSMAFSLVHSFHCVTKLFNVIWYRSGNPIYFV